MKFTRRNVMRSSASFLAMAVAASPARAAHADKSRARLKIHSSQKLSVMPINFIGLSYESQELQDPAFFSPTNKELIAKFRALAAQGTLRLGGDTVDYAFWSSDSNAKPPVRQKRAYVEGDPHPDLTWRVTPEALHNLRGFLDATDWKCLYSLNFGTSLPEIAAAEARAAVEILGPRLLELHIGNEADRFGSTIRDPLTWDARAYMEQWLPFARAVVQAVPDTKIGMPDISLRIEWFPTIVDTLKNDPLRKRLGCLAHHHYIGGPPSNPYITIPNILKRDDSVLRRANAVSNAARQLGTVWRMTEGNSCFLGGKPEVSDVFAASLWMADYLLLLGKLGYAGVNIHGGSGEMVASSLGGLLPGERLMADPSVPHNRPFYTPIAGGPTQFRSGPTYYGMQFAAAFVGLSLIPIEFYPGSVNATAYAAHAKDGNIIIAIINKDENQSLDLDKNRFRMLSALTAPSLTSREISLSSDAAGNFVSTVPAASAALMQLTA